jgi:hypothetical protein
MRAGSALLICAALGLAAGAEAQSRPEWAPGDGVRRAPVDTWTQMSPADARRELFGADLSGHVGDDTSYAWRECIDPSGLTLYEIGGQQRRGRLRINERGEACFRYPPDEDISGEACFGVGRAGRGYEFRSQGEPFRATSVRRVTTCERDQNLSALPGARHAG